VRVSFYQCLLREKPVFPHLMLFTYAVTWILEPLRAGWLTPARLFPLPHTSLGSDFLLSLPKMRFPTCHIACSPPRLSIRDVILFWALSPPGYRTYVLPSPRRNTLRSPPRFFFFFPQTKCITGPRVGGAWFYFWYNGTGKIAWTSNQ